ncbi:unnamed protein product [Mytilus coruscus]|uniref:Uncharacterized protein n=1 Tax=Mytilus coruscus TaxID=42192 RepID=A0A6J8BI24_MYTCO|nr:unnamed protein product [Mytilus coruscus]
MLVIVTCISICIRKYYRNKYRKQKPSDDNTTHNYDEIEYNLLRGVSKIDSQSITGNIAVNGIIEDIIYQTSDANTYTNEWNYTNCQVQVFKEASLHVTHCKSETDAITVYQNDTLTGNSDHEDQDVDLHLYEPIGLVQVSTEDSVHVTHGKSETDAITVYENDTLTGINDLDVDLHLYETIGPVEQIN